MAAKHERILKNTKTNIQMCKSTHVVIVVNMNRVDYYYYSTENSKIRNFGERSEESQWINAMACILKLEIGSFWFFCPL